MENLPIRGNHASPPLIDAQSPEFQLAVHDLLSSPFNFRALSGGSFDRGQIGLVLEKIRRSALESNSPAIEALCLEALMHLRLLNVTERTRLAYLWAHNADMPPRFAAASIYSEYLARSAASMTRYDGHDLVKKALDAMLEKNPRWKQLLYIQVESRMLNELKSLSAI
jgi:hypothetical protein